MRFGGISNFFRRLKLFLTSKEITMIQEPLAKLEYHFPGITVLVPEQKGDQIVKVNNDPLPDNIPDQQDQPENFKLIRYIANITLFSSTSNDPVLTFDPPIEIRVGYTIKDIMASNCDYKQLKLAYWDGSQWVIFRELTHEYHILPPETGLVAEAKISSWVGDPPIGWGM